ncbi:MAG: M28 family peptidase, partial [bacterium]|nr:M28 family peptidase [bacterium]
AGIVYVNYGRREDFQQLRELGVSLQGRIAMARYGGNYRGFKARYAEDAGAVGVIIYSDPANYGYRGGPVYPEGRQWSASTVQRGSIKTLPYDGDPLTPFVAALAGATSGVQRLDPDQVGLPQIPVTPLAYGAATEILSRMTGAAVPADWQGGLPFAYRLEGGEDLTVRLQVEQPHQLVRIVDVCGTVEGSQWPGQEVILGSHYDAWTFGAVDPNGGTAMLLTLAQSLGKLARKHPPRRSITICHWDAEEYGIIGSTEFVEQHAERLQASTVAYINADMAVAGPNPSGSASPTLKQLLIDAAASVEHPDDNGGSLLARWNPSDRGRDEPAIGNLGGGSDHVGFYTHLGIPSMWPGMGGPSLYHSGYDDFAFYERFCDPDFTYGPAVARLNGLLALRLANADVLPYALARYPADLATHVADLRKLAEANHRLADWSELDRAITGLHQAVSDWDVARADLINSGDDRRLLAVNEALLGLEKAFVAEGGLQERPWSRSLYAAPDPFSGYASWMLPGLRYEVLEGGDDSLAQWLAVYVDAVDDLTARVAALIERAAP